jgi:hypothetical protein
MRWFPWQFRIRFSRQHLITMLLLAVFFAALMPVPISLFRQGNVKDRSQPFPCQDRPCACHSAEQCRKKCCCFTPEQKMAWGKRHDVMTFDITIAEAKPTPTPMPMPMPTSVRTACCSSKLSMKPLKSKQIVSGQSKMTASNSMPRSKIVIGVIAQKCQGVDQTFAGVPIFILPQIVQLETLLEANGERLIIEKTRFELRFIEPPVPPPRLS